MSVTSIVGLDLSLTATGIACPDHTDVLKPPKGCDGMERLVWILGHVKGHLKLHIERPLVVIEDLALASITGHATERAGLAYIVRFRLWQSDTPHVLVPPASLKKFATGKGNANKAEMMAAAYKLAYDGPADDNAIDAWWLRQMGLYGLAYEADDLACQATIAVTAYRTAAVAKITWPEAVAA